MAVTTMQFITQMKLQELERQRDRLRTAYQTLADSVPPAAAPGERLRRLYAGLRDLKYAGQPLHPEMVNLEILLHEVEAGAASAEVSALWLKRLEDELQAGRLRSEFVYLFGAILEEWTRDRAADESLQAKTAQAHHDLLQAARADPAPNQHQALLDPLFDSMGPTLAQAAEGLRKRFGQEVRAPIQAFELQNVLTFLSRSIYRSPRLRDEARRFLASPMLQKELSDALTILVADLEAWDWPAGMSTRALWTRNKWRMYLDDDLSTACLLEIVGRRWLAILDSFTADRNTTVAARQSRLKHLLRLKAPKVILDNERRLLREAEQGGGLVWYEEHDPWAEDPESANPRELADPDSVTSTRTHRQHRLRALAAGGAYDEEGDAYDSVNHAVVLVNAEVQLLRRAFPGRPLFVLKTDVRDYYPSIPHDVILTLLKRLGLPQADVDFAARFIAPPLAAGAGESMRRMRRGVPMGYTLSGILAELLMRLMERHVLQQARVRIVRLVDDVAVLAPRSEALSRAWEQINAFCAACGLAVNPGKSGAVGLEGGSLPEGLPGQRPRWAMLELDEAGAWHVQRETFEEHLAQSRERVQAAGALLSRVQLYNANVRYLTYALVLGAALGQTHTEEAEAAVRQYHQDFSGGGRGIVAGLGDEIRARFLGRESRVAIPESWMYWPLTAGGLGLTNPLVVMGQFREGAAARRKNEVHPPAERLESWAIDSNDWVRYYQFLLDPIQQVQPEETKVMKTLVDDFIKRGADISSGQQKGLGSYWRWVLYIYGPEILARFGSFRFLITELVPLQLIGQQRMQDTSLEGIGPGE